MEAVAAQQSKFTSPDTGKLDVPRPPHWGGYLVKPLSIEFWRSGGRSRLHDRVKYTRTVDASAAGGFSEWAVSRLAP